MKTFPKPLQAAKEKYYLEQSRGGDVKAREVLIYHNMRLVAHIVKKYSVSEADAEDMISVGTIGLIKAIDSFDINKGIRLATYASRCIENEILMMLRYDKKRNHNLYLQDSIGIDKEGNEISLIDVIEADEDPAIERYIRNDDIADMLAAIELKLNPCESYVIQKRYGISLRRSEKGLVAGHNKPMTQKEIADSLSISRSYVSRIEKKAVEKLRKAME